MNRDTVKDFFNEKAENWDKFVVHDSDKIKYILSLFTIQKDCKILDAGCGTGILENFLTGFSDNITAIDFSEKMIEKAKEKFSKSSIKFLCLDFFDIEEKFDLVFLYSIYPHILNKEKLAEKLYEILNKDGRFIIFHTDGKDIINSMHNVKAKGLSVKIKPMKSEKVYFNKLFNIDKEIDDKDYFLLSGTVKE